MFKEEINGKYGESATVYVDKMGDVALDNELTFFTSAQTRALAAALLRAADEAEGK